MNKPVLDFTSKRIPHQPRGSVRVRPGAVLWPSRVSLPVIAATKPTKVTKKGSR